jgi:ABC-2 type transport system permease protein
MNDSKAGPKAGPNTSPQPTDFAPEPDQARAETLLGTNLVGLRTIMRKEIKRVSRIWVQTIVPPAITMTLYFVIFGSLIGRRIGEMDGMPYIVYIAPGLVMMAVITNSFSNVVSSFFSAKLQLYLEELLVSPLSTATIVVGYMVGGIFRGLAVGVLVTGVALMFTRLTVVHPWITLSVVVLVAAVFSLAGLLNAVFAKTFDDISIVPTFVLTPLTYLGGVFFSISLLSPAWQAVAMANPILYMVNAFRYGVLGVSDIPIGIAYSLIVGLLVALFALNMWLLTRGRGIRS